MKLRAAVAAGVVALVLVPQAAHAAVLGTTGAVVEVTPPPSVAENAYVSNSQIRAFDEKAFTLNINLTASMPQGDSTTSRVLPRGICVQSHLVHFEPSQTRRLSGSVTFSESIVGLLAYNQPIFGIRLMDLSDPIFGNPGTVYATGVNNRGLELTGSASTRDRISLSGPNTLNVDLYSTGSLDEIRVLTACDKGPVIAETSVLAGSSLVAIAAVGGGLYLNRRRRRGGPSIAA